MPDFSEYSLEELSDLAKTDKRISEYTNSVEKFIKYKGIFSGSLKVPTFLIFYIYRLWQTEKTGQKASKVEFFRIFNKHFSAKRSNKQRYYLLSDCFDLSEETLKKAEEYDKKIQRWKNKPVEES